MEQEQKKVSSNQRRSGKYFPSAPEIKEALPGLFAVVLPITVAAEILWYLEIHFQNTFFVDIFIAAVLALIVANFVVIPQGLKAGTAFAQRWFLRLGIIVYGLKFNYRYLSTSGWENLVIVVVAVISAIAAALAGGKLFGLDEKTSALLGSGTAICGITAIMATAPSIKAREESTAIAIAGVLFWGTLALFAYPLVAAAIGMPAAVYGAWCGGAIHDLPQIIAAARQGGGNEALQSALMVKMIRIGFIVVVVLGMNALFTIKEQKEARSDAKNLFMTALQSLPGFVISFFVVVLTNTLVNIPESIKGPLATYPAAKVPFTLASLLLTMAIIGICCNCTAQTIKSAGMKALGVGFIAFFVQSALVLWLSYAFLG